MAKTYNKVVQVGVWVLFWFTYHMGRFNTWFWLQIYLILLIRTYICCIWSFYCSTFLSRLLRQLSCCSIFTCCTSYSAI